MTDALKTNGFSESNIMDLVSQIYQIVTRSVQGSCSILRIK